MLELNREILFRISLGLHLAFAASSLAVVRPLRSNGRYSSGSNSWRVWSAGTKSADIVRAKLAEHHYGSILVDTREMAGELLYYLRDVPTPLYVWPSGPMPTDHYEMTRPFTAASPEPVLYVSLKPCPPSLAKSFGRSRIWASSG